MKSFRIQTYARRVSVPLAFAEDLWRSTGLLRLKQESRWVPKPGDVIINWGCSDSQYSRSRGVTWLNHPDIVRTKQHKLQQYQKFTPNVPTVEWTTDKAQVCQWLTRGKTVYCRVRGASFGGRGIQVITGEKRRAYTPESIPDAEVYTLKFSARREYRVHVFCDKAIDVTQKRRRNGADSAAVRSFGNGYVFCHDNVEQYPQSMVDACRSAVTALGLQFGAVDVLLKDDGTCAVLEVNSAPGIEGTTYEKYKVAITEYILEQRRAA